MENLLTAFCALEWYYTVHTWAVCAELSAVQHMSMLKEHPSATEPPVPQQNNTLSLALITGLLVCINMWLSNVGVFCSASYPLWTIHLLPFSSLSLSFPDSSFSFHFFSRLLVKLWIKYLIPCNLLCVLSLHVTDALVHLILICCSVLWK